jgi:hypothetical protein
LQSAFVRRTQTELTNYGTYKCIAGYHNCFFSEATLSPYFQVRYWPAGEAMVNAIDHYAGKVVDTVLTNLEASPTRYYLRLLGYSRGGIGKMSSPILQFQIGKSPNYSFNIPLLCTSELFENLI